MCLCFLQFFFSCNWYLVSWCFGWRRCLIRFQFLILLRFDLWPKMWSILETVPCAIEKNMYSSAFGWHVLKISMRSISSKVSFKTCFLFNFVLMICLLVWVGCESLLLWLCYCQFLLLCLLVFVVRIELLLCWVHRYLQLLCLPLGLIPWSLCSVLLYLLHYSYF